MSTQRRDVKDGRVEDATRQPEQVKAFRDTWELGIHSYLSYLRDRLLVSRDLLTSSGSVFVQIGDENAHLVRCQLDEVFGRENWVSDIVFKKTSSASGDLLSGVSDYVLWYAKNKSEVRYHQIYFRKELGGPGSGQYTWLEEASGQRRKASREELDSPPVGARFFRPDQLTSQRPAQGTDVQQFEFEGKRFSPGAGTFKTDERGLAALQAAHRLLAIGNTLTYVRFLDDFPAFPITNLWDDTVTSGFADPKVYVVQTNSRVIERCLLMASDPGDLLLDPTCGSGTTAYVAEQWGRRWITVDTSRVALALARQRLMAGRFPNYRLADALGRDIRRGFVLQTVPHVTLKSIANNPDIRPGMERAEINRAIAKHADQEVLHNQPEVERSVVRVTGPFTVESLSPGLGVSEAAPVGSTDFGAGADFIGAIISNLRAAGVQNSVRHERLIFDRLDHWPGKHIHAVGEYSEDGTPRRAAITIGPQYGTIDADLVRDAAKEAAGFFDILIICGFAFDAYIPNEFRQLGSLTILKANMNPDLSMGGDLLKKTDTGNLFTVFGEPDIDIRGESGSVVVEIRGLDVYDPTTGQVRPHTTAGIACWFIDTAYDGNSFFVRHAYFTGGGDPYKSLKAALKADVDEEAWASLSSTISRPFDVPKTGKIAVKVINYYGDEVMKIYDVA